MDLYDKKAAFKKGRIALVTESRSTIEHPVGDLQFRNIMVKRLPPGSDTPK